MAGSISDQLQQARRELLDLSGRNRLLNTPLGRGRSTRVDVVDERSTDVFRLLVLERREMSFAAAPDESATVPDSTADATQAEAVHEAGSDVPADGWDGTAAADEDKAADTGGGDVASKLTQPEDVQDTSDSRYADRVLQTSLASDQLQKRLLRLHVEARTFEEEQGVNCLFLALGFLEWYEAPNSDRPRFAPLVLIPVELNRKSANAKFRIRALEDDLATNLSLQEKLKVEFRLSLPDLDDTEELDITAYFDQVERLIADQPRWRVQRDRMTLWFFSFAKFLMFRDLLPEAWPQERRLEERSLVRGLLSDGFRHEPPVIEEQESLDAHFAPRDLMHVVDADSSQAIVIEEMRRGRHLIVQGPPGTGKSQTITNMIATAVKDGRRVLFVAEKMAALQVVKSRLDRIGLGDICLELHSHKASKREVFAELERTLQLGKPKPMNFDVPAAEHVRTRDRLNRYVEQLHTPIEPSGLTPYAIIGRLCRLKAAGIEPLPMELPDIRSWSQVTFREKQQLLRELTGHVRELGVPVNHPCWGITREEPLLPSDVTALQMLFNQLRQTVADYRGMAARLAGHLRVTWSDENAASNAVHQMVRLTELLQAMPPLDREAFADEVWTRQRSEIERAVSVLQELSQCRAVVNEVGADIIWETPLVEARRHLAAYGRSWLRWLCRPWRDARRTLLGVLKGPAPRTLDDKLRLLDHVIRGQKCRQELQTGTPLDQSGRAAFGSLWKGPDSPAESLTAILDWDARCRKESLPAGFPEVVRHWQPTLETRDILESVRRSSEQVELLSTKLIEMLGVSLPALTGQTEFVHVPLAQWAEFLERWSQSGDQLNRWIVFQRRLQSLGPAGLGALIPLIESGYQYEQLVDRFELQFAEVVMRQILRERDALAGFDRLTHEDLQRQFQQRDRERLELARREVALAHYDLIPAGGDAGEVGIVRAETRKKRRHRSVRQVLKDAGRAVQAMKPVFMMSPISVAQFLEPGSLSFDVLIIDEASQVRPVEALGAIARCQQLIVVGDNKQLPPTQFFDKAIGDDESEPDDGEMAAGDVESILDLCDARNLPSRMLRWHYRSRHHSLIAVSNREFYENGLFVVPSPERKSGHRGLHFRHVSDGIFDRGASRTNHIEARAVAQEMLRHALTTPQLSLGVGTFSVAQRDAILDELELLRRQHPEAESFFSEGHAEPWFVKNLENIQGDERDVILISVGYGRDRSGYFAMGFGPLSMQGGERRLNVLITRARERCEVFSSIRAADIDVSRTQSRGTAALKLFLEYAETGRIETGRSSGREVDSEFEAQVADQLRKHGYELECQVGVAGFFIDLAVVAPDQPGRYLLGIECDGATYHASRWARDRDRLREQVLTDHGWTLYRIWSTDWFQSQDQQLRRLLAFIEDVRAAGASQPTEVQEPAPPVVRSAVIPASGRTSIEREAAEASDGESTDEPGVQYQEADFAVAGSGASILEMNPGELRELVLKIVEIEGPVHVDEVARRLTTLCGQTRTGVRITAAVEQALKAVVQRGELRQADDFYWLTSQTAFPVRDRELVNSATLRKPEYLPPVEIRAGIKDFVIRHISATSDECVKGLARLLGFKSTSQQLRQNIEIQIEWMVAHQELIREGMSLRSSG